MDLRNFTKFRFLSGVVLSLRDSVLNAAQILNHNPSRTTNLSFLEFLHNILHSTLSTAGSPQQMIDSPGQRQSAVVQLQGKPQQRQAPPSRRSDERPRKPEELDALARELSNLGNHGLDFVPTHSPSMPSAPVIALKCYA